MKIYLRFENRYWEEEQQKLMFGKLFPIDFPTIPRKGEVIICDKIKTIPNCCEGFGWYVDWVEYRKMNNKIIPILTLIGDTI
tara:strand:- start:483 stop:728 length:246 start_codon:yes stop_codon:yes gene_type:complete